MVITFVLLSIFISLLTFRLFISPIKRDKHRFQFFGLRDRLIELRIEGKFDSQEYLYNEIYTLINLVIPTTEKLNLRFLIDALKNKEEYESDEQFWREFAQSDKDIQQLVVDTTNTMMRVLRENSILLVIGIRLINTGLSGVLILCGKIFRTYRDAYRIYGGFQAIHERAVHS